MSDFGTMALIHRQDGADVSDSDRAALEDAIAKVQTVERDRMGRYGHFSFRIGVSAGQRDGGKGFCLTFTEYWIGDDEVNEGLDSEALLARDEPDARQCCDDLEGHLGQATLWTLSALIGDEQ